jgi:hypothetical protein
MAHNFTVFTDFSEPNGKFADTLGNIALIDCKYMNKFLETSYYSYFNELIATQPLYYLALNGVHQEVQKQLTSLDFCNYAMTVGGVLEKQVDVYTGTKQNMLDRLGEAGNQIVDTLTLESNVTISTPLRQQLAAVEMITVFFNSIMTSIVFFLAILCTQLIYSLMLSDVEEKTFEFGMLRALGFNTSNLVATIAIQAFTFALPGLLTGMVLAAILNGAVRHVLYTLTNNSSTYALSQNAIVAGCLIGIVIPLFSNVLPIQTALGKNLRASLDLYRRSNSEIAVRIKKLADVGLSVPQFVMAVMLVVLGVLTYYVAPMAFIYQNFELFFVILNGVLILMIMGLTFIAILLLPYIQSALLSLFLYCYRKDLKLKPIIAKNMEAHEKRNTKTAIMFAVCLSFLIFSGSTFKLIGNLIVSSLENQLGADLSAVALSYGGNTAYLDEGPIAEFLQQQQDRDGSIQGWSFASPSMKKML